MKARISSVLLITLLAFASTVSAQERVTASEKADKLRLELVDVQSREESLRLRLDQLEEDLRRENIERYFAGIGSTRPEELRENRRRQLTIERDGIHTQLRILAANRTRLENAISAADIEAYHQSAMSTTDQVLLVGISSIASWAVMIGGLVVMLTTGAGILALRRSVV